MAGSTDSRRRRSALAPPLRLALFLTLSATGGLGCATGYLLEASRRSEAPLAYREAYTDGRSLWLVYEAETSNRSGEPLGRRVRSVAVELAELDPSRGTPLDAVRFERLAPARVPRQRAAPVALWIEGEPAPAGPRHAPRLLVEVEDGRQRALTLVDFDGLPPDARFHSGTLVERSAAPWLYPTLPLAAAWDAASLPVLVPLATPFFVAGE